MGQRVVFLRTDPERFSPGHHPRNTYPSMNVRYGASVAAGLGFNVDIIDAIAIPGDRSLEELLAASRPDAVVCDIITPAVPATLAAIAGIDAPVVAMGQHASSLPHTLLAGEVGVDCCIVGEPEHTLAEALPRLLGGGVASLEGVPGTVVCEEGGPVHGPSRSPIEHIDELPYQAHASFHERYHTHYPMRVKGRPRYGFLEAGRGCPHSCIFCSQTLRISFGSRVRLRSPENVAQEMEYLVHAFDVNAVVFLDDAFCLDHRFAHAMCDELIERGLDPRVAWLVQARADAVDDDLLQHMREAGCTTVCFGIESGSPRILEVLRKGETMDQVRAGFSAAREAGLLTVGFFMIGNPTETREEIEATMAFCHELAPDFIQVAFFTAYPGSAAFAMEQKDGDFSSYTHYNAVVSNRSELTDEELTALHRRFYLEYLTSPRFVAKYARNRLPQALSNWRTEADLLRTAMGFFTVR